MIQLMQTDGDSVWVNPNAILYLERHNEGSYITLMAEELWVTESPEQIDRLIWLQTQPKEIQKIVSLEI